MLAPKCRRCGKSHWSGEPCADGHVMYDGRSAYRASYPAIKEQEAMPVRPRATATRSDDSALQTKIEALASRVSILEKRRAIDAETLDEFAGLLEALFERLIAPLGDEDILTPELIRDAAGARRPSAGPYIPPSDDKPSSPAAERQRAYRQRKRDKRKAMIAAGLIEVPF